MEVIISPRGKSARLTRSWPSPFRTDSEQLKSRSIRKFFKRTSFPSFWSALLSRCWRNNRASKPNEEATTSNPEQALFATITGAVGKAQGSNFHSRKFSWKTCYHRAFLKYCIGLMVQTRWFKILPVFFRRKIWIDDASEGIKSLPSRHLRPRLARSRLQVTRWNKTRFAVTGNHA